MFRYGLLLAIAVGPIAGCELEPIEEGALDDPAFELEYPDEEPNPYYADEEYDEEYDVADGDSGPAIEAGFYYVKRRGGYGKTSPPTVEQLETELNRLAQQNDNIIREVNRGDYEALQQHNAALQNAVSALQARVTQANGERDAARHEVLQLQSALSAALAKNAELQAEVAEIAGLRRQVQALTSQVSSLQAQVTALLLVNQQLLQLLIEQNQGGGQAPVTPTPPTQPAQPSGQYSFEVCSNVSNSRGRYPSGLQVMVYAYRGGVASQEAKVLKKGDCLKTNVLAGSQVYLLTLSHCNGGFNKNRTPSGLGREVNVTAANGKKFRAGLIPSTERGVQRDMSVTLAPTSKHPFFQVR